jgi:hypothetical protein
MMCGDTNAATSAAVIDDCVCQSSQTFCIQSCIGFIQEKDTRRACEDRGKCGTARLPNGSLRDGSKIVGAKPESRQRFSQTSRSFWR